MRPVSTADSRATLAGYGGIIAGVFAAAMVTLYPEGLHSPAWIAYLASGAFVLAGGAVLARSHRRARLAHALVMMILAVMLVVELWIALGPGARECSGGVAGLSLMASERTCRTVFGLGAVLVTGMLGLAMRLWRRTASSEQ